MQKSSFILCCVLMTSAVAMSFAKGQRFSSNDIDDEEDFGDFRLPVVRGVSGADCGPGQCSMMGFQRMSEPRCEPLSEEGSPCRMNAEAENKTLAFPNMMLVAEDVYMQFCPCAEGLVCFEAECRRPEVVNKELQHREMLQKRKNRFRYWTLARQNY